MSMNNDRLDGLAKAVLDACLVSYFAQEGVIDERVSNLSTNTQSDLKSANMEVKYEEHQERN